MLLALWLLAAEVLALEGFALVMMSYFAVARRLLATLIVTAPLAMAPLLTGANAAEPPKFAGMAGDFSLIVPPLPIPDTPFEDVIGQPVKLDSFKGKVVLLNLWATWCPPCVAEMPSLDKLQAELGGNDFTVVAVSMDQQGIKKSAPFYRQAGLTHLDIYNDTRAALLEALHGHALPMSFLIDRNGEIVGTMEGPARWDSADAKALIQHYLAGGAS
jgi:thiol-disulfide isomerase/thioredoxin